MNKLFSFATTTTALGLLSIQLAFASPTIQEVFTVTGTGYDMGHAVAYDNNGNMFYAGHAQGSNVDVNSTAGTDLRSTDSGSADAILTKLNADGTYAWTRMMGDYNFDRGSSLATDNAGNIYLAGNFRGTINFNPGGVADVHSSANGGTEYDNYVTKINADGSYGWTRVVGGLYYIYGKTIDVDSQGNVYVTGAFSIPQDFAMEGGGDWRTPVGGWDIFISKINANGTYAWTRTMGSTGMDMGHSVVVDNNDNVYFTGHFQGTVDLNPTGGVSNFTSTSGSVDAYIIKYDSYGNYQYTKTWGGSGWDGTYNIETDAANNIYVSGLFGLTTDLDPGPGVQSRTAIGSNDLYVTKLDPNGNWLWSNSLGQPGFAFYLVNTGGAMTVDQAGNVYMGRCYRNSLDFNPSGGDLKTSAGGLDAFVTKYNTNGSYEWTHVMGGAQDDCVNALATSPNGDLLVAGNYQGSANFDPEGAGIQKTGGGGFDLFVAQFSSDTTTASNTFTNGTYMIHSEAVCETNGVRQGTAIGTTHWDPSYQGTKGPGWWYSINRPYIINTNGSWIPQADVHSGWVYNNPAVATSPAYNLNGGKFGGLVWGWRYENGVQTQIGSWFSGTCN